MLAALSIPNIVKHSLHVSVIVDSDMVIWCGHGELCIHHLLWGEAQLCLPYVCLKKEKKKGGI